MNSVATQAKNLLDITKNKNIISKTKTIAITSGKGGVGKSTICANLAYVLSKKNKKIAIIDADIGLANMQVLFDVKPLYSFYDFIEKGVKIDNIITKTKYKNIVLFAGRSGHQYIKNGSHFIYSTIIDEIKQKNIFDYILVDTSAGITDNIKEFLVKSDNIIAVTTTDPSALTDVYAMIKLVSEFKNSINLIFNQTKLFDIGKTISNSLTKLAKKNNIQSNFMIKYLGNVSSNLEITTTARLRKLFSKEFECSVFTYELEKIANKVLNIDN